MVSEMKINKPMLRHFRFTVLSHDRAVSPASIVKSYPQFAKHVPLLCTYADGASVRAVEKINKTASIISMLTKDNIDAFRKIGLVIVKKGRAKYLTEKEEYLSGLDRSIKLILAPRYIPAEDTPLFWGREIKCNMVPSYRQFTKEGLNMILRAAIKECGKNINDIRVSELIFKNVRALGGRRINSLASYLYNNRTNLEYSMLDSIKEYLGVNIAAKPDGKENKTYYDAEKILKIVPDLLKRNRGSFVRIGDEKPNPTHEQEKDLCRQRDMGNYAAVDALVVLHHHLVEAIVYGEFNMRHGPLCDECLGIGKETLQRSVAKLEPGKGTFHAYSYTAIMNAISKYLKNKKRIQEVSIDKPLKNAKVIPYTFIEDNRYSDYFKKIGLESFPTQAVAGEIKRIIMESHLTKKELAFRVYMGFLFGGKGIQDQLANKFKVRKQRISIIIKNVEMLLRENKEDIAKIIGAEV